MKFSKPIACLRRPVRNGFTLIEVLISVAVGVAVIGTVVALSVISAQNFVATANYVKLSNQSRNALDLISREIRNATSLVAFSTNNPQYLQLTNVNNGSGVKITYDAGLATVTMAKAGESPRILLTGCDSFGFQLFNRYPNATNYTFYKSTNAVTGRLDQQFCKVINMNWKCSRVIVGSKLNTEIVQTAQIVLRNQVNE